MSVVELAWSTACKARRTHPPLREFDHPCPCQECRWRLDPQPTRPFNPPRRILAKLIAGGWS